jgi:hypothetical protein
LFQNWKKERKKKKKKKKKKKIQLKTTTVVVVGSSPARQLELFKIQEIKNHNQARANAIVRTHQLGVIN